MSQRPTSDHHLDVDNLQQHEALVRALMKAGAAPQGDERRQRIDTHISSVILKGAFAYKIKKPLDLGFLNFLTLDARRHWCEEELRLNRRTAPDIYLSVVPITGDLDTPRIDGDGQPIDWAVKMRRFDPQALLAHRAQQLDRATLEDLAGTLARFHQQAEPTQDPAFGAPARIVEPMRQNIRQLQARGFSDAALGGLSAWTERTLTTLSPQLRLRLTQGHIRECHGDLHLGNIVMIDDRPVIFDAIEFNAALHWIDPINDIAFLTMDLHKCARSDLVDGLLDRYLYTTGDYAGLSLLRFYEVYRALVRAKVAAIRLDQDDADHQQIRHEADAYIALAQQLTATGQGAIVIAHGPSGSGKSTATAELPWRTPTIRVRSDVERKRLLALTPQEDATGHDGYSKETTQRTYQRLARCAEAIVTSGRIALIDATFLQFEQRQRFHQLAVEHDVPFLILNFDAPREVLEQRILKRRQQTHNVSDADLPVLQRQLVNRDPLTHDELRLTLTVRPDRKLDIGALRARLGIGDTVKTDRVEPGIQRSDLSPST